MQLWEENVLQLLNGLRSVSSSQLTAFKGYLEKTEEVYFENSFLAITGLRCSAG